MPKATMTRATLAAFACSIALSAHAIADDLQRPVDIPAGDLISAIKQLCRQSGADIVFRPEQVEGLRTQGARGNLSAQDAVVELLKGTPLQLNTDPNGAMLIALPREAGSPGIAFGSSGSKPAQSHSLESGAAMEIHLAQSAAGASEEVQEVVIRGRYELLSTDTSGATNLPLPIEKVPQSISLVSGDFLKAADLKSLGKIAEYTPGAVNVGTHEGFKTLIMLRGFTPNVAIDGLSVPALEGSAEPEYAIIDRLEFVKGPSSVIYGVSGPGGVVNFVTKSATPQMPDYVTLQAGMWNSYRLEGQLAGPIDSAGRTRAIGVIVRDQGDSFMHVKNHTATSLYGRVESNLSDSVSAFLYGGYERMVRTGFDGIPTYADGTPAPLPRSFFIGSENMELGSTSWRGGGNLTWHASDMLDLSLKGNFVRIRTSGETPYAYGLDADGNVGLAVDVFPDSKQDAYSLSASGVYRLDSLGLAGSFVSLAASYWNSSSTSKWNKLLFDGEESTTANIFDGEAAITALLESGARTDTFNATIPRRDENLILSAQSVLQAHEHVSVLLGASYTKPNISNFVGDLKGEMSYRAGLTWEFLPGVNAYASLSQSFVPQNRVDVDDNVLPPLHGEQYEGGVKYRSASGRLLLTGAAFQIKQTNAAQFDQLFEGVDRYRAIGEVTHKGVELEALGQLTRRWQISGGLAYLDPKVTQDRNPAIIGETRTFRPKQTASVFSTYSFEGGSLQGFTLGGGVRYVGSQRTSLTGATADLPSYTIADATLGYTVNDWSLQLNAKNLFDKHYFINNWQTLFYGNTVGEPFNVSLSVRRLF